MDDPADFRSKNVRTQVRDRARPQATRTQDALQSVCTSYICTSNRLRLPWRRWDSKLIQPLRASPLGAQEAMEHIVNMMTPMYNTEKRMIKETAMKEGWYDDMPRWTASA